MSATAPAELPAEPAVGADGTAGRGAALKGASDAPAASKARTRPQRSFTLDLARFWADRIGEHQARPGFTGFCVAAPLRCRR